jgi:hypothetical protein
MTASQSLMGDPGGAIRSGPAHKRVEIARRITDLFPSQSIDVRGGHAKPFGAVLVGPVGHVENKP